MRFALAQINPTVGDLVGNADKIIDNVRRSIDAGCDVVLLPELALCGYPPKDLLLRDDFIKEQTRQLDRIAVAAKGIDVLLGYAERNAAPVGRPLHNAAALLRDGRGRQPTLQDVAADVRRL